MKVPITLTAMVAGAMVRAIDRVQPDLWKSYTMSCCKEDYISSALVKTKNGEPPAIIEDAVACVKGLCSSIDDFERESGSECYRLLTVYFEDTEYKDVLPTIIPADYKAPEVVEDDEKRAAVSTALQALSREIMNTDDLDDAIEKIGRYAQSIVPKKTEKTRAWTDIVKDTIKRVHTRSKMAPGECGGISCGLKSVDEQTDGFHPGELIVIGGRAAMGKTSLTLSILDSIARVQGVPVLFDELEMTDEDVSRKQMSMVSGIPDKRLKTGRLWSSAEYNEWDELDRAGEQLSKARIITEHVAELDRICQTIRQHVEEDGIRVAVVDTIQRVVQRAENRVQEVTKITSMLKQTALDLGITIIAISQINRQVEGRGDKRPTLADLKESGSIEQDADTVILLYREDYYKKDSAREPGVTELIFAKNRYGESGAVVKVAFLSELTRFCDFVE